MPSTRPLDPRQRVDGIVQGHQLGYSLNQLRLLGWLLLITLVLRPLILVGLGLQGSPALLLDHLVQASGSLPLLPLAFALVLLGGGRQRMPREFLPTDAVRQLMLPLALVCLLGFPALTGKAYSQTRQHLDLAQQQQQELRSRLERKLEAVQRASDSEALRHLAAAESLNLEISPGEPLALSRWRLQRLFDRQIASAAADPERPPAESAAIAPALLLTSLMEQELSGVALLWLDRQGRRAVRRHGLTPGQFFRSDPLRRGPTG